MYSGYSICVPGPLQGVRIIEFAGLGPAPFGCMVLADMGAEVIRIERVGSPARYAGDVLARGRKSVAVDLKQADGAAIARRLIRDADVVVEGFRPGVVERLGVGPDDCMADNPRLVYARMTGYGQEGPMASVVGHDINYISLAGALEPIGRAGEAPVPPLNLLGDFGGGGMMLAFGVVCALFEAKESGQGQVIDVAMVDGASLLMSMIHGWRARGDWLPERGTNELDTGAPYYDVYECADGKYLSVGAIEPQFYATLRDLVGLDGQEWEPQDERGAWPARQERLAEVFRAKPRDEWCALLERSDACVAPVLSMTEAPHHPHAVARQAFVDVGGVTVPAPAPRFGRTPGAPGVLPSHPGQHTDEILAAAGCSADEIAALRAAGAVA